MAHSPIESGSGTLVMETDQELTVSGVLKKPPPGRVGNAQGPVADGIRSNEAVEVAIIRPEGTRLDLIGVHIHHLRGILIEIDRAGEGGKPGAIQKELPVPPALRIRVGDAPLGEAREKPTSLNPGGKIPKAPGLEKATATLAIVLTPGKSAAEKLTLWFTEELSTTAPLELLLVTVIEA